MRRGGARRAGLAVYRYAYAWAPEIEWEGVLAQDLLGGGPGRSISGAGRSISGAQAGGDASAAAGARSSGASVTAVTAEAAVTAVTAGGAAGAVCLFPEAMRRAGGAGGEFLFWRETMAQAERWVRGGRARVGDASVPHASGPHPAIPAIPAIPASVPSPELRLEDLLVVDYARLDVFPRRIR